jgi:hypothetical protein
MTTMRSLLPMVAALALAQSPAREARACSAASPGTITVRNVLPRDGATSVPINTRVIVDYGGGAISDYPKLQTVGGVAMATVASRPRPGTSILTPATALLPDTTYQVLSDIAQVPCTSDPLEQARNPSIPLCVRAASVDAGGVDAGSSSGGSFVIASFTTTTWSDDVPPNDFQAVSAGASSTYCGGESCCGTFAGFLATIGWDAVQDNGGMGYYEVSSRGSVVASFVFGTSVTGFLPCGWYTGGPQQASFVGIAGDYEVVAVDLAGNRGQPHAMPVAINCDIFDGGLASPYPTATAEPAPEPPFADAGVEVADAAVAVVDAAVAGADAAVDVADAASGEPGAPDTRVAAAEDAATAPDATGGGPDTTVSPEVMSGGGCSCRIAGRPQGSFSVVLAGLALALAPRARRRRR